MFSSASSFFFFFLCCGGYAHAFLAPAIGTTKRPVRQRNALRRAVAEQQLGSFEPLADDRPRSVVLYDWVRGGGGGGGAEDHCVEFREAWDVQKELLRAHLDRLDPKQQQSTTTTTTPSSPGRDSLILLQHHPVYTLGTASDEKFLLFDRRASEGGDEDDSLPRPDVVRIDRGGEVTYHGPGQITAYPVLDLRSYRQDVHWYVRALEEVAVAALRDGCGLPAERDGGTTGVWLDGRKVAAVGVKCRRWITQHGLAVNVRDESLAAFADIVPCGLEGRPVTCVNAALRAAGRSEISTREMAQHLKAAFEKVFHMEFVEPSS
jgi:lipoyl(octanoyl) transferase